MPTLPPLVTTKLVALVLPIANAGPEMPLGLRESGPGGGGADADVAGCLDRIDIAAPQHQRKAMRPAGRSRRASSRSPGIALIRRNSESIYSP